MSVELRVAVHHSMLIYSPSIAAYRPIQEDISNTLGYICVKYKTAFAAPNEYTGCLHLG